MSSPKLSPEAIAIQLTSGNALMTVLLVVELDRLGLMSKDGFADLLDRQADAQEANPPNGYVPGTPRLDLKLLRGAAAQLRKHTPDGEPLSIQ